MLEVMSASGDSAIQLRAGPSAQHQVIGVLEAGQFGELMEINADGTWAKIDTGRAQGWLPSYWIVLTGEMSIDFPAPTQRTRDGLVQAWEYVNVRAGPGRAYRVLGRLKPGQIAHVIGQSADQAWWHILFEGQAGWVSQAVVQFGGDERAVRVTGGDPGEEPATATPVAP